MTKRRLRRLSELLGELHEEASGNGRLREDISDVRMHVNDELDKKTWRCPQHRHQVKWCKDCG